MGSVDFLVLCWHITPPPSYTGFVWFCLQPVGLSPHRRFNTEKRSSKIWIAKLGVVAHAILEAETGGLSHI